MTKRKEDCKQLELRKSRPKQKLTLCEMNSPSQRLSVKDDNNGLA